MRSIYILLPILLLSFISIAQNTLQLDETLLTERDVATGLNIPWDISWGPDDHIWVTERPGYIKRVEPHSGNTTVILDHTSEVENEDGNGGSEYGMLGMAFHPDFDNTPKIYVVYCYASGFQIRERLVTFDWDGSTLTNETYILDNIPGGGIHDGSRLLVTKDDKLLMTVGDRGSSDLAQDMSSLNGKVLRMNLDGSVPDDNPIDGSLVYSYGHRNSQGICYGPDDLIYSSEHGAQSSDELNIIEENRNYGWPNVQGECNTGSEISFCNANNVREPLAEWSPCVAVNGLAFYDHPAIPEWDGKLMMAVLGGFAKLPRLSVFTLSSDGSQVLQEDQYFKDFGRIRDVCINPNDGAVYFATNGPNYPGSGPNRIVEYRNLLFVVSTQDVTPNQFVKVFPNPASKNITISTSQSFINQELKIYAFTGEEMLSKYTSSTEEIIDISDYPSGQYYIAISNDKGLITKVFIKD